jgi:hypothetical protein
MNRSTRWLTLISQAQTEEQLVILMREYLSTLLPADLERLPPECHLKFMSEGNDISRAAVTFAQCDLKGGFDARTTETLQQMVEVFVKAQVRLREILGRKHDPSPPVARH